MSTTTIQLQSPSTFQLGSIYARGSAIPKPGCKFVLEEQLGDVAYLDTWDEEDKAMTRIVKGSIIKFGPGLNIVDLVTGFESCILHIKNLPEDATDYEIRTLLMQHDLDITRFAFIGVERNAGGKLEAQIMTDSTAGGTLHSDSGRLHFRGSKLEIELSTSSFAGTASTQDPVVFTAAPYFQTARYITEYFDGGSSCAKLCQSNGRSLNGHCAIAVTKLSSNHQCPVCYDSISTPLQLGCGHTYCITCLRHLLDTAHEIGQFPLTCVGDESQCQAPIAIPTIQEFLSQTPFNQLLEAAFTSYITKRPTEFKYCTTPDCTQIYRSTPPESPRTLRCPSCSLEVCSACDEGHRELTCAEFKRRRCEEEQERLNNAWMAAQDGRVKKCPHCKVLIEKDGGCNRMACRCGTTICWKCMGIFTDSTIYPHMQQMHHGYFD